MADTWTATISMLKSKVYDAAIRNGYTHRHALDLSSPMQGESAVVDLLVKRLASLEDEWSELVETGAIDAD